MEQPPSHVSLEISQDSGEAVLSDALARALALALKQSPDEVRRRLATGSITLGRVVVNDKLKGLVKTLKKTGFTVKTRLPEDPGRPRKQARPSGPPQVDHAEDDASLDATQTGWKKGEVIEGLYEVRGSAHGGMGRVYFVYHRLWAMMLAIKTPLQSAVKSEASLLRFMREAELWVDIGVHPNIATCFYARVIQGLPRLFIEFVDGGSFDEMLEKNPPKSLRKVTDLMLQFCHGMIHAEEMGLIHRDIKPANCLLTRKGILKITDFGLVKRLDAQTDAPADDDAPADATQSATIEATMVDRGIMGSPWYMAPERFRPEGGYDIRSDIYSFGVMLYDAVLGQRPFNFSGGFSLPKLIKCHMKSKPLDPLSARPDLPVSMADIMTRCLQKKAEDRYASFVDLAEALESVYAAISPGRKPRPRPNLVALKADSLNNQAVSLLDLGRAQEAIKLLEDAHSANTDHLQAVYNLHVLRWQKGEASDEDVVKRMESLRIEVRESADYQHLMGLICLQRGDKLNGVTLLRNACLDGSHYTERWKDYSQDPGIFVESLGCIPVAEDIALAGHFKRITAVGVSPEGDRIFSVGEDRSIRVWDVATARCLKNLRTFTFAPAAGAFSPNGALAATGYGQSFRTVDLWDMNQGRTISRFPDIAAVHLVFSPDSALLAAAGEGGLIRVWDVASKQLKWQARKAYGAVSALAFTGDSGGLFIGLEDGRLLALRRDSPDPALEIQAHDGPVLAISVCGNGEGIVTGGADESVRLWDVQAGAEVKRLTGHRGKVVSVGFAAGEEYLVSGATDGAVKIWDCEKARCCRTIRMPAEELAVCHVLPDGRRLIMAGAKGSVRVWSLDAGWFSRHFLEPAICRPRTFEELAALHAAFKKSVEDFRKAWHKGHAAEALEHYESAISVPGFSWSKEAILIRNLLHETSRGATLRYSTFVRSFQGHSAAVASVAPSDDSLAVLTGGLDGVAAVWDVVTGRCVKRIDVGSPVKAALFLPRRQGYITWSEDQALRKWDSQGNPAGSVSGVAGPVYLSKDGANVHALSLANRRLRIEISGGLKEEHGAAIPSSACLCFSSDLEHVYSLRDGALIQRWDFSTGRISGAFRDLGVKVSSLTPALADDKVIAGMANGEITVYVVGSGINVSTLRGHSAAVSVISPGPGEDVWVSGSDDCSLRVWDLAGQTCLALLEGHSSPVRAARFFPNASMIVSGGSDGSVRLWGLEWDFTSFRS